MPLLAGCAVSQTDVLAPYTLANGQYLQDVVTIGTDKKGGAPIVTVVNTYDINEANRAELLSHDAASSPGLATVIAGGLAGSIPNAVGTIGAAALHRPDRIALVDCNTNQNQSQQGTSIGGTGGTGGMGGDGGNSIGLGVSNANATGGTGGTSTGGAAGAGGGIGGGAGGAGGGAASNGGAATATSGTATGTGGNASGGNGGLGGAANALAALAAENSNGDCGL